MTKWLKAAISLILITYLIYILDWSKVLELEASALLVICSGICITLILIIIMSMRWKLLVQMQTDKSFSVKTAYSMYLIGSFFSVFMPGAIGGDIMRIKYSADHCQLSIKKAGLVVGTERLFGLTALLVMLICGFFLNTELIPILDIGNFIWIIPAIVVIILSAKYFISKKIKIDYRLYLPIILLSTLGQFTDIIIVYLYSIYFALSIPFVSILMIMPLVFIATVIPISPGGLGVREGALVGLMSLFSVDVSTAVIISFMVYLTKVGVGMVGLPLYLRIRGKVYA